MQSIQRDTMIDGRYRVLNRLGSGGMADVYCAEDTQLGRRVALKLLYRRFAEDEEFVERFRREASSAAGLQHPNIVGVFDRGEWDGTYYIAMEYLERAHAQAARARARRDAPGPRDRHHRPGPPRRPLRAQARRRAPRLQAPQRDPRRGGPRQGHRLRDRARRRLGHDRDRLDHGHRPVPLARAGAGRAGQPALGPLLDRRDALRAADRPRAVRRRVAGHDRAQARLRAARIPPAELNPAIGPALDAVVMRALEKDPARAVRRRRRVHRRAGGGARPTRASWRRRCASSRIRCRASRSWRGGAPAIALVAVAARRCCCSPRVAVGAYLLLAPEKQHGARRGRQPLGGRLPAAAERRLRGRHRDGDLRGRGQGPRRDPEAPARRARPTRARR